VSVNRRRVAIVGAGPIGMEAALAAAQSGYAVSVYEAGSVGEHWRRFSWVRLFTPFHLNASERGRTTLRRSGVALPPDAAILTAGETLRQYLEPLANLPELSGCVHERCRVGAIGREGIIKPQAIAATGDAARVGRPFVLRLEPENEPPRFASADIVIDASGTYATPCATGAGGLPALGEEHLATRVERHLPDLLGSARSRYSGQRILLIGGGHSAATALVAFEALAAQGDPAAVSWVHPAPRTTSADPFVTIEGDTLPERHALTTRANRIAREAAWLTRYPGATVTRYESRGGSVRATVERPVGEAVALEASRVLALVGYRPDTVLTRELHVHHCYATEGPMGLASAVLAAASASPDAAGDCLKQTTHGAETLRTPEPGFFILGAKSYGRNPQFLMTLGHRQIDDVMSLVEADEAAARAPTAG